MEKAHKLPGILKSIKDLPDEVKSIVMELEILTESFEQGGGVSAAGKKVTRAASKSFEGAAIFIR